MSDNPYQSPKIPACRTESLEGGPPIRLAGTIEESDYVRALLWHVRPRLLIWVLVIIVVLVFAVARLIAWLGRGAAATELPAVSFILLFFAGCLAAGLARVPWRFRRLYRNYRAIQSPFTLEMTEEGFHATSEHGETRLGWDMFLKYKESARFFLLYQTTILFHILPKRLFVDADDVDRARDLFSRKVKRGHRS
ncbi:MAG: YcxB family protein [Pirellulales bacterium]